jgi:hypothetical protein
MSQCSADSLSTVEDKTLYETVYNAKEGVSREKACGGEQSQVSDTVVRTFTRRLPVIVRIAQAGLVIQDGEHVDRLDKKRVRSQDSDLDPDDSHPPVKRNVPRTVSIFYESLTKRELLMHR